MTPEQQRIAIAEACGWKHHPGQEPVYGGSFKATGWMSPNNKFHRAGHWKEKTSAGTPDYLNDLNAIHEAEKVLTPEQRILFIHVLGLDVLKICPLAGDYWMAQEHDSWAMSHATAAQRAEAFLRTLGKL